MKKVKKGKLWNTWDIWEEDKSFSSKLRRKKAQQKGKKQNDGEKKSNIPVVCMLDKNIL